MAVGAAPWPFGDGPGRVGQRRTGETAKQKQVTFRRSAAVPKTCWKKTACYGKRRWNKADTALATVLDELERVLLDVAHSPGEVTPAQLENIRQRIASRGILFKVRVVGRNCSKRSKSPASAGEPKWIEEIGEEQDA